MELQGAKAKANFQSSSFRRSDRSDTPSRRLPTRLPIPSRDLPSSFRIDKPLLAHPKLRDLPTRGRAHDQSRAATFQRDTPNLTPPTRRSVTDRSNATTHAASSQPNATRLSEFLPTRRTEPRPFPPITTYQLGPARSDKPLLVHPKLHDVPDLFSPTRQTGSFRTNATFRNRSFQRDVP